MFNYAIADFLAYDKAIWLGMVNRYIATWWWVGIGASVALALAVRHWLRSPVGSRPRFVLLVLAVCWAWIGWQFHWQEHRSLNWAAGYWVTAFAVQAGLLLLTAIFFRDEMPETAHKNHGLEHLSYKRLVWLTLAVTLLTPAILGWWLDAIPFPGSEWFGLTPDATALMTLVLLALWPGARLATTGALAIVPVLSLAVSTLFNISLQIRSTPAFVLIGAVAVVVLLRVLWFRESPKAVAG